MNISSITGSGNLFVPQTSQTDTANEPSGFEKLWNTVENLNKTQVDANTKVQDVMLGKSDDTQGALMDLEKADIQMQFATTLRDKLTQGYQQIINMQL